jgi:hypothetical protein
MDYDYIEADFMPSLEKLRKYLGEWRISGFGESVRP